MASKRSGQQIQLLCHTQCIAMHNTETTYHEIIDDTGSGSNHIHITYGTSRMLIVSFTSQIFTMENVLVKINSIPQTLHIPISLHYSLIITTELHAAASTCCQTVDCCLCWMYRFVWTNALCRGFYLHFLNQWERARYNTATPGPVQQFSLYFILKNLLRCHESWFSLASLSS